MGMLINPILLAAQDVVSKAFPEHPFSSGIDAANFERVVANYLTMSLAFPFLQAGAQLRLLLHYVENEIDITRDVEITAAVGAFLTWDEMGGHAVVQKHGNKGLPLILNTEQFHSNLLQKDIRALTGKSLAPAFDPVTKKYLRELEYGLSSIDPVTRVANMVAFETHAGRMISALWGSASLLFGANKEDLAYFRTHVGGDDPAEQYHIDMTSRMIEQIVHDEESERFLENFEDAYRMNLNWCAEICRLGM
jgi:hypothetical protein